jgi:hypothetical protein
VFCMYVQILSLTDSTGKKTIEFGGDDVTVLADIGQNMLAKKPADGRRAGNHRASLPSLSMGLISVPSVKLIYDGRGKNASRLGCCTWRQSAAVT